MKEIKYVGTHTDMKVIGTHPEEGYEIYTESSFVLVQYADGSRKRLNGSELLDERIEEAYDVEYGYYINVIDSSTKNVSTQKQRIRKIEKHLAAGGTLNLEHWTDIDPEYGSEAYSKLDSTGYFYNRERREEGF